MFPFTFEPPFSWSSSFTVTVPDTVPIMSACWPTMSPSTFPCAPITTLAEQWIFPTSVPSILMSPALEISPLREVPAAIMLALPPDTVSLVSDLDFWLNIVIRFKLFFNLLHWRFLQEGGIQYHFTCFSLQDIHDIQ